jgi:RNA polymerase-binding protein DksA
MSPKVSKNRIETLNKLRERLQHDMERLEEGVDMVQSTLAEEANRDDRIAEIASLAREQELDLTLEEHLRSLLERVDAAIAAIEAGTYGACVSCGRTIPLERLEAVPYADRCVECQRRQEKS